MMSDKKEASLKIEKIDKIIYLLECLVQNQSFGEVLTYPDGEPLKAKGLTERYVGQVEHKIIRERRRGNGA